MPIVGYEPTDLDRCNVVQVDSDAPTNAGAVIEIEEWAGSTQKGFVRTNEYWLRQIIRNGKRLFRGICYKLTDDERLAIDQDGKRVAEIVRSIQSKRETSNEEKGPS